MHKRVYLPVVLYVLRLMLRLVLLSQSFFAKDRQRLLDPDDRVSRTKMNVFILVSVQTVHKHFPVYYFLDHLKGLNF